MAKFSANFWGSDLCSTAGFDTLVKRLKEGKRMCQDFEEYLEKRARIEKDYGDNLMKLAKFTSGKDEIGTLRKSWDELKIETEAIGKIHLNLGQKIMEGLHHSLKEFREQQRDIRKKSEDTVKRSAAHKKTTFERCNRLKATYETKCREADKAEENHNRLQTIPTTKPKDLSQAQRRMEGSRAAANNADMTYQDAVKTLEDSRSLWDREMELLCKQFQELEEKRISFVRHQMWTYCNLLSQATVNVDEACESVRKVLEDCNVDADIDLFVREKATGTERPSPVPYENYYHPTHGSDALGGSGVRTGRPVQLEHHKELPPLPLPLPTQREPVQESVAPIDSVYSSIPETLQMDAGTDENLYATPKAIEKVIAVYDYDPQGNQELTLAEGDVVNVIGKEDDVWWCGELNGKMGMFPAAYVEPYADVTII